MVKEIVNGSAFYGVKRQKKSIFWAKRKWLNKLLTAQPFMALMARSAKKNVMREAPKKWL